MIKKIKVLPNFETASGGMQIGHGASYALASLPVGHEIDTNNYLVSIIGDNGSGKTTLLVKLSWQFAFGEYGTIKPYFELDIEGGELAPKMYHPREKVNEGLKYINPARFKESEANLHFSSGQNSISEFTDFFDNNRKEKDLHGKAIYLFDQPEDGISLRRRRALAEDFREFAFDTRIQCFVATHEPSFPEMEGSIYINLDKRPAETFVGGDFDRKAYQKGVSRLDEGRMRI